MQKTPNDKQNTIARWGSEPICKRRDTVPYGYQRQAQRTAGGPQKRTQRLQTGHELEPNATQGRARALVAARRHQGKTKEAAARVHRGTRWDPRDEMGADMVTNGVQKGVQLGDPGDDQNRAPAAARARSSMSKTPQKEQQNWVVRREH